MDSLLKDLRYALRNLRRNPGFTLLPIVTLALGIGANTAIFSVVHAVVLEPLPYPRPDRLVFIISQFPSLGFDKFWVSVPEFIEFRDNNRSFESVGGYRVRAANLGAGRPVRPPTALVTDGLLRTLGVRPLRGRDFTVEDTRPGAEDVAILSYKLWQSAFGGSEDAVGRVVDIDAVKTRIVGVMPPGFDVHDERVELYLPLTIDPANPGNRGGHFLYLIGRLNEAVTLEQARTDLERLLAAWPKPSATAHAPNTQGHRLRFDPLQEDIVGGARTAVWVLQAAVGFVLLIACANLASLLLARAESRQREFALRAALGAGRRRMLAQFLTEGMLLALAGGALGVVLAGAALRAILTTTTEGIPRLAGIQLDPAVLAFTLGVSVLTGIVFGLVPLFRLGRQDLHGTLKEAGARATPGTMRRRARGLLVVGEVAMAVVLVVGAGLMLRSFWNLVQVDAGFSRAGLATFRVVLPAAAYPAEQRPAFFRRLIDRLAVVPGVSGVAAMSGLPPVREVNANDTDFEDIVPTPQAQGQQPQGPIENVDYYQMVSHEYTKTMGIPVVEGRSFEASDVEGPPVAMVNETLARTFFPGRSAIGRRLRPGMGAKIPWFTIVGVVKDVKQGGVGEDTGTELYMLADQLPKAGNFGASEMNIVLRAALPLTSLADTIQKTVGDMDPSLPIVGLREMEDVFAEALSRPRFLAVLLAVFAGLALLLAAVGAYGILSYLVAERQQEIGIRMALGAGWPSVLGMVLRQGMVLAAAGLASGLAAALALTRVLESLLFDLEPHDPVTLAAGVFFMGLVALAACLVPAYRATSVDPIVVLRAE